MKKFISLSLALTMLLSLITFGLAGCGGSTGTSGGTEATAPAGGGETQQSGFSFDTGDPDTLKVIQNFDPEVFQPGNNDEQGYNRIVRQIYETLFMMTPEGEVTPWLATGYTWETPTRMVITLRDDVKFSDGSDFTAGDVAWTINYAKEIALPNSHYNVITGAEVIDTYTVALNLKEPCMTLAAHLCNSQCTIGSKKAFEEGKGDWMSASVIGTGPYKLVKYTPGDMVQLTANEHYWRQGEPKVKNIDMRIVKSNESAATEAKTLNYDIVIGANTREFAAIDAIDGVHMDEHMCANTTYLLLNTAKAPMDNIKVREAFARAVNVAATVKLTYGDFGQPASALVAPNILGRNEATYQKYYGAGHDVETAKKLLAEAGFPNGVDLEITVESTDTQRCDMAEAIQAQVAAAGINLKVNKMESAPMREYLGRGNHQICIYGFTSLTMEADGFLAQLQPGSAALARIGYDNQNFFKKYSEGAATEDITARGKIWEECCEMLMQDYTMIPVWHKALGAAVRDNVEGFYWATDYEQVYYQFISK